MNAPPARRLSPVVACFAVLVWFAGQSWAVATAAGDSGSAGAAAAEVRVERTDGTVVAGVLESIDARELRLTGLPAVPVAAVRRVMVGAEAAADRNASRAVTVMGPGLRLTGSDFLWQDRRAVLVHDGGRIELPIDLVRTVGFQPAAAGNADPPWLTAIPEKPSADVVVIARPAEKEGPGFELVECAITAVDAEQVAVVLDDAPIRVNRAKVAGLHWLRPAAADQGGTQVDVVGGSLRAESVTWNAAGLEINGTVKLPGHLLRTIDYAAGRTVRLATLTAERTTVEPFFGGLLAIEGVDAFFAPRFLAPPAANAGCLVMRPRTVVVWRVPADSRRFRSRLASAAGPAGRSVAVTIRVDDRDVFRSPGAAAPPGAESAPGDPPIDIDVTNARRLTITVEAPGSGGPVLFHDPVFEK